MGVYYFIYDVIRILKYPEKLMRQLNAASNVPHATKNKITTNPIRPKKSDLSPPLAGLRPAGDHPSGHVTSPGPPKCTVVLVNVICRCPERTTMGGTTGACPPAFSSTLTDTRLIRYGVDEAYSHHCAFRTNFAASIRSMATPRGKVHFANWKILSLLDL